MPAAELRTSRRAGPQKRVNKTVATTSLPKDTTARKRMVRILKEAEERYRHELMDEGERLMLHDRIVRLKIRLAKDA